MFIVTGPILLEEHGLSTKLLTFIKASVASAAATAAAVNVLQGCGSVRYNRKYAPRGVLNCKMICPLVFNHFIFMLQTGREKMSLRLRSRKVLLTRRLKHSTLN